MRAHLLCQAEEMNHAKETIVSLTPYPAIKKSLDGPRIMKGFIWLSCIYVYDSCNASMQTDPAKVGRRLMVLHTTV